ncbi:alkene reductase [Micromonosporaceae bacterium Da 78-11]
MAPMTRSRAYGEDAGPTALTATYYGQRAGVGLIVTEGTQPSAVGQGYLNTPGLHSDMQTTGWKAVTAAVHERGGLIFAQLMHTGRIGHPSLYAGDGDLAPVGPSAVRAAGQAFTADGPRDFVTPRALDADGIATTIADFTAAARNAIAAGFDGVELHGANGYLLHQFLSTNANRRDDAWGATTAGRIRLTVEVARSVAAAIGADRLGLRISPANPFNDITEDDHRATYLALVDELNPLGLAYLHVAEGPDTEFTAQLRERWTSTFVLNPYTPGSATGPEAVKLIETRAADLVSYGVLSLANPDLVERLRAGGPFNTPDLTKLYGGDHEGYTDYPLLTAAR